MPHCCRALRNTSLVTSERRFPRGAPRLMVLLSRGVARNMAFHVTWHFKSRGTPRGVALHAIPLRANL